jgi:hypothetical protein
MEGWNERWIVGMLERTLERWNDGMLFFVVVVFVVVVGKLCVYV